MKKLPPNDRLLKPVRPNAGIEAAYRRCLIRLIDAMHNSVMKVVHAVYAKHEPTIAQDALPSVALQRALKQLIKRWTNRFDSAAPRLAEYFSKDMTHRSDVALAKILKDAGWTMKFKPTQAVQDILGATIAANVSLIKSIPQQYLGKVEGAVMRSVQRGGDLQSLVKELQKLYPITKKRAALIARDQNNKANAAITKTRQLEMQIKRARWVHSGGGHEPRPAHVKASRDGVTYDISKGWYDPHEKKFIYPGELINCKCISAPIIPGFA